MANIVIAHGVLGFDKLLPGPFPSPHYFNGVAAHLTNKGHRVIESRVDAIGSIVQRGNQLGEILRDAMPGEPLHIIAHSMGGLDARHAITNRRDVVTRVKTLVTIGTPHRGSPVADAVARKAGPLFQAIPSVLMDQLLNNGDALRDLTTDVCIPWDEKTADQEGVRYVEVAGDASKAGNELLLFRMAAEIGKLATEINDGVVTKSSALRDKPGHKHLDDWPVDHVGEIGWSLGSPMPIGPLLHTPFLLTPAANQHLARYETIARLFTASAANA
jgi:triacylglycerol lipase